jgi:AraC family ethanolamine operon transcriptional activator
MSAVDVPSSSEFSSRVFRDFDSFREMLRGWDTEPVQLSAGPLELRWQVLSLENLGIAQLHTNRRSADSSAIEPGTHTFTVALAPHVLCGYEVPAGSLIHFGPGRDYRGLLPEGFRSLEISAADSLLRDAGICEGGLDELDLDPARAILNLSPQRLAAFEAFASRFGDLCETMGASLPREAIAAAIGERALALVSGALREAGALRRDTGIAARRQRYDLARAGLDLIDATRDARLRVREVATALGVTERALEYAFRSALGIAPSRYLLARRLNHVRGRLVHAGDGRESVSAVATREGFAHLGRFAEQYRLLFGEPPSRTLRAAQRVRASGADDSTNR